MEILKQNLDDIVIQTNNEKSIENIGLSVRSVNALTKAGIKTVQEMVLLTEEQLYSIRNLGTKSINEILSYISAYQASDGKIEENGYNEPLTKRKYENTLIRNAGLSVRSTNALTNAGFQTIKDLITLSEEQLYSIRNLGVKSINEVLTSRKNFLETMMTLPEEETDTESSDAISFEKWIEDPDNQDKVREFFKNEELFIDELEELSVKAYNCLRFAGISELHEIVFLDREALLQVPGMKDSYISEIDSGFKSYFEEHQTEILKAVDSSENKKEESIEQLPMSSLIHFPQYQSAILNYVRDNDVALNQITLSVRGKRALSQAGLSKISDIILMDISKLRRIKNLGEGSIDELMNLIHEYLEKHRIWILNYIAGKKTVKLDDAMVREKILTSFQDFGFKGKSLQEIVDILSQSIEIDEAQVKTVIGQLIVEKKLEYVDYRIYRVYPSFDSILDQLDSKNERGIRFCRSRMAGETLESIGQKENLTRERVRQIIQKTQNSARSLLYESTGLQYFDEDYYQYFFSNYDLDEEICSECFGISVETYNYLDMNHSKGQKDIEEALSDPAVDNGLKIRIINSLHRDSVRLDGKWIRKKIGDLEEYVLQKYCYEEKSFSEFAELYNQLIYGQDDLHDSDLEYTEKRVRGRRNRLMESNKVFWKAHEMIRYYDINARDYTELLEEIKLDSFKNTGCSTSKLFNEHRQIMDKYDIRDHYELHNLLRKIIPEGSFNDFHCDRMPNIHFGEFDRRQAFLDLLSFHSPISINDFAAIVQAEFGYDIPYFMGSYVREIDEYYHNGILRIDFKEMPEENSQMFLKSLTEDFYLLDDIKRMYADLFPDADLEEVNPYTLKAMGFQVHSFYILRNWTKPEDYIKHLLLKDDIIDTDPLKKYFRFSTHWYTAYSDLKKNYEILEFEPNQTINIRKLNRMGVSKDDLRRFCDNVYDFIEEDSYFSALTLRENGFSDKLYVLGFEDWFYANLLCVDPRFSYTVFSGIMMFYKGNKKITVSSFLEQQILEFETVDYTDLTQYMEKQFGCSFRGRWDILDKIKETGIFFDPILERFYANEDLYYQELDNDY